MKTYHIDTHGKIENDTVISMISDLHISDSTNLLALKKVIEQIKNSNPDYIFLLGDIVNEANVSPVLLDNIYAYLSAISSIGPVYAVYGNHDIKNKEDGFWREDINPNYLEMLNSIKNFQVLDNESTSLPENIQLFGIKLPFSYYAFSFEDEQAYLQLLEELMNNNLFNSLSNSSYNILLQHTPNNIFDRKVYLQILKSIRDYLDKDVNLDLIISGHQHNGLVPSYVEDLLPGNRGIIGITGRKIHLFQDNCRGIKPITDDTTGIILPAVTSLAEHSFLNKFFPIETKTLVLKR